MFLVSHWVRPTYVGISHVGALAERANQLVPSFPLGANEHVLRNKYIHVDGIMHACTSGVQVLHTDPGT